MDSSLLGGVQFFCSQSATFPAASSDLGRRSTHRVDSHQLARSSRQDFCGLPLYLRLPHPQELKRRRPENTRCLYSPLVKGFEASRSNPIVPTQEGGSRDRLRTLWSPPSPTIVDSSADRAFKAGTIQRTESDIYEYLRTTRLASDDLSNSGPQDPVAAAHGDQSLTTSLTDVSHDVKARRSARLRPATMSLTQNFTSAGSRAISCAVGVAGRPPASANKLRGPVGLLMALSVAFLGLATAVQKKKFISDTPQKMCSRCDGYGVECCDVCEGRGRILWEGKMSHMDSCPRCFGSCTKKVSENSHCSPGPCRARIVDSVHPTLQSHESHLTGFICSSCQCPRCGGSRMKKGEPPVVQRSKFLPPKSI